MIRRQRPVAAGVRERPFVASDGMGGTASSGEMARFGAEGASAVVAPGYGMGGTARSAVPGSGWDAAGSGMCLPSGTVVAAR
jgi:hypothetical protein